MSQQTSSEGKKGSDRRKLLSAILSVLPLSHKVDKHSSEPQGSYWSGLWKVTQCPNCRTCKGHLSRSWKECHLCWWSEELLECFPSIPLGEWGTHRLSCAETPSTEKSCLSTSHVSCPGSLVNAKYKFSFSLQNGNIMSSTSAPEIFDVSIEAFT